MRILIVTQYFYPENFRINDLAIEFKKRGHEVIVFTGKPNYPIGEYYEGYSFKGKNDEVWENIQIYRCPLRPRKTGNINLLRNYISFIIKGNKDIKRLYQMKFDVIYVFEVSPITVALPAIKLKKNMQIPLVINIQDLWPDNITAITGLKNPVFLKTLNILVDYIYKKCDLILCASPSFVDKIKIRIHEKSKVIYWPQFATLEKKNNDKDKIKLKASSFNVTFTGNIGEAQGLELAIYAAKQLETTNLHWNFIGDGRNRKSLEALVCELGLQEKVTFHGFVTENVIPDYLEASDAALLILKPDPVFEMTIPAKLQTYLACGMPIIGCVSGEGKRIIDEAGCGITSDNVSIDGLVDACKKILAMDSKMLNLFSQKASLYSEKYFNKESLLSDLEKYMEEIKNDAIQR